MKTNTLVRATIAVGLVVPMCMPAQRVNRQELYDQWVPRYSALEAALKSSNCGSNERVYLDAYRASIAYYYYRLATPPSPSTEERRSLEATLQTAERGVSSCLQVGRPPGFGAREGQLATAAEPSAIDRALASISSALSGRPTSGSSGVSEMVPLPKPIQKLPPPPVEMGADPAELQRLQMELAASHQERAALQAAVSNVQQQLNNANSVVAQLTQERAQLAPIAAEPTGVWEIIMQVGQKRETSIIVLREEPLGLALRIGDEKDDIPYPTRDDRGNYVYQFTAEGKPFTLQLDLSQVKVGGMRTISGTIVVPGEGALTFIGFKAGDPRLATARPSR